MHPPYVPCACLTAGCLFLGMCLWSSVRSSQYLHLANTLGSYIFEPFILFPLRPRAPKIHAIHRKESWIKASTRCQVAYLHEMHEYCLSLCHHLCCMFSPVVVQIVSEIIAFLSLLFFMHLIYFQFYLFLCKITRVG